MPRGHAGDADERTQTVSRPAAASRTAPAPARLAGLRVPAARRWPKAAGPPPAPNGRPGPPGPPARGDNRPPDKLGQAGAGH